MTATGTDSSQAPRLSVRGISKSFGHVKALSDVSFDVMPGEVVGLLGDNGAGKSTLIKTLCGVHQPDTGGFVWEGEEVIFDSPRHAMATGISVVYQDLAVIPILSIYRNMFLGREAEVCRKVAGISFMLKQKAKEIAADALTGLGIHVPDVESPVAVLSGGERQSISLARAVYFQHQLLILDEPTAALSLKETAKVLGYVDGARQKGASVIIITHNLSHAWQVSDRFVVLYHGGVADTVRKDEVDLDDLADLINTGRRNGGEGLPAAAVS
jgi:simple sugar transport system ATP-binding protein